MTKLSDAKFIAPKEAGIPGPVGAIPKLDGDELAAVRSVGDAKYRQVMAMFPQSKGQYEPVSFAHPDTGRRVYGWLVASDGAGNGRVEIGDGEYAVVPARELRRVGEKDDIDAVRKKLSAAFAQVSLGADGIRRDLVERDPPQHLEENNYVASLNYATANGLPSGEDLLTFCERNYPNTTITDIDYSLPGRIAVCLRLADVMTEAEMDPPFGGEVTEVLDPDDVEKTAATRVAQNVLPRHNWDEDKMDMPADKLAAHLVKESDHGTARKFLETYFKWGGMKALLKTNGSFNTKTLLEAAAPVVKSANPKLYQSVVAQAIGPQMAQVPGGARPGQLQTPAQPGATTQPGQTPGTAAQTPGQTSATQTQTQPQATQPVTQAQPSGAQATQGQPVMPQGPGSQPLDPSAFTSTGPGQAKNPRVQQQLKDIEKELGFTSAASRRTANILSAPALAKEGLPPSTWELERTMKMHKMGRRGDYIVASVDWDKKLTKAMGPKAVEHAVVSFVKGAMTQNVMFGAMGHVHVLKCDGKAGKATVQFASDMAGPLPEDVT